MGIRALWSEDQPGQRYPRDAIRWREAPSKAAEGSALSHAFYRVWGGVDVGSQGKPSAWRHLTKFEMPDPSPEEQRQIKKHSVALGKILDDFAGLQTPVGQMVDRIDFEPEDASHEPVPFFFCSPFAWLWEASRQSPEYDAFLRPRPRR